MRIVEQDFGPVGTVVAFDKATDRATLSFRGGAPPAELARLTPPGSVFALARVDGNPARGRPVDAAYLVSLTEPKDGRCECRFVYRYRDQLADWAAVTYRAVRLGTGRGPVRLRLVDRAGLPPAGLQVRVSRDGFQPKDAVRDQGVPRDGLFETAHAYAGLAYVVVAGGDHLVAQIPVPVIDDRVTTCRVTPAPGGEARQQFELDVSNAHRRLFDILRRLKEQHDRLKVITDLKNHGEALAEVRHGLDVLDGELAVLRGELSRLRHEAQATDKTVGAVLDQCDIFVAEVRKRRDVLRRAEDDLEKAIDDEQKQAPLRDSFLALRRRAVTQQIDAEFDEAIKTYDEILMKYGDAKRFARRRMIWRKSGRSRATRTAEPALSSTAPGPTSAASMTFAPTCPRPAMRWRCANESATA